MTHEHSHNRLNKFFDLLSNNRGDAAAEYISLSERLCKFFEWRGCVNAEELTDKVFDRIGKKLEDGEQIKNPRAYAVGVARFVLLEYQREVAKLSQLDEDSNVLRTFADSNETEENELKQKRFACLDFCLERLDSGNRVLLVSYFDSEEKTLISNRKRLAEDLGISLNSLRIKISRMKSKLEKCILGCLREKD